MIIAGLQLRAWNVLVVKKIFSSVGSRDFQFVSSINRTMRMPHGFQYCATIIASGCNRHPPKRTRLANKRRNRDLCSVLIVKCKEQEIRTGSVPKFPTEISPPIKRNYSTSRQALHFREEHVLPRIRRTLDDAALRHELGKSQDVLRGHLKG